MYTGKVNKHYKIREERSKNVLTHLPPLVNTFLASI